ncbi:MAG: hypothetical protein CVV41_07250 [Candidatus Riflebacteria bacterium HGW-Riflebacteria-1]|nr:MAG: hypothetical protein CVV41_07250 [Candidatus Riflebacteria bacterium HGW-Riflebacteria-1]
MRVETSGVLTLFRSGLELQQIRSGRDGWPFGCFRKKRKKMPDSATFFAVSCYNLGTMLGFWPAKALPEQKSEGETCQE